MSTQFEGLFSELIVPAGRVSDALATVGWWDSSLLNTYGEVSGTVALTTADITAVAEGIIVPRTATLALTTGSSPVEMVGSIVPNSGTIILAPADVQVVMAGSIVDVNATITLSAAPVVVVMQAVVPPASATIELSPAASTVLMTGTPIVSAVISLSSAAVTVLIEATLGDIGERIASIMISTADETCTMTSVMPSEGTISLAVQPVIVTMSDALIAWQSVGSSVEVEAVAVGLIVNAFQD